MTAKPTLSVVIPTYQRRESVRLTLERLAGQSLPASDFEVVVVVDGSSDGTREMLERVDLPLRLAVVWQENAGRAAACNAGIARARGDIVVILDDDMRPVPGFLENHLRVHRKNERVGVVGAAPIAGAEEETGVTRYVRWKFAVHLEKLSRPGYELDLRDFYSGNFSIAAVPLRQVGGFDPAFRLYGNEDLDLFLRLSRAGVRFVYDGDALAYQTFCKTFADVARDAMDKGRTAVLLGSKHPEAVDRLKLGTFREGPLPLLLLRDALLAMSRIQPALPQKIVKLTERLERMRAPLPPRFYLLVLGYYYWVGALGALASNRSAGAGLRSLDSPRQEERA